MNHCWVQLNQRLSEVERGRVGEKKKKKDRRDGGEKSRTRPEKQLEVEANKKRSRALIDEKDDDDVESEAETRDATSPKKKAKVKKDLEEKKEEFVKIKRRRKRSVVEVKQEKIDALLEDQEETPCPLHELFPALRHLRPEEKRTIADQGLTLDLGRFSPTEDQMIINNYNRFVETRFSDTEMSPERLAIALLGYFRKSNFLERRELKRYLKSEGFLQGLARGMRTRTLFQVYTRARRLLNPLKTGASFTEEDRKDVLDMARRLGRKWTDIGEELELDPYSCGQWVRISLDNDMNVAKRSPFTAEENATLINALMKGTKAKTPHDILRCKNIRWRKIAKKVKGRTEVQCFNQFKKRLAYRIAFCDLQDQELLFNCEGRDWEFKLNRAKFIYCLFKGRYKSEDDIDWDLLKDKFADVVSLRTLTLWWHTLKTEVRDYENKSYGKIIKRLIRRKLPELITLDEKNMIVLENFADA